MALAFLLPLQAAASLSLQVRGPAHTHRGVAPVHPASVESWRPLNPVFRHRGAPEEHRARLPAGFEWAESMALAVSAEHPVSASAGPPHRHDDSHATARHHHGAGDPSVQAEIDATDVDGSAGSAGSTQGGAGLMAWATPSEGLRWTAPGSVRPEPAGAPRWSDAFAELPERPPRHG
jgi:hypothetical protein